MGHWHHVVADYLAREAKFDVVGVSGALTIRNKPLDANERTPPLGTKPPRDLGGSRANMITPDIASTLERQSRLGHVVSPN